MTAGTPAKRKRPSGFPLDSDDEEEAFSDPEGPVTKRAKLVSPPEPLDLTGADEPGADPVTGPPGTHPVPTHVVATHPLPTTHPGPVALPVIGPPVPAVVVPVPVVPRLIPSTGKGAGAVTDDVFNTTHEIDYEPLNEAADAVRDNTDKKLKKPLSEALGEEGAVVYLQAHTGHFDIELHHATDDDPHQLAVTAGQRWSHAVGFNGAHVADISYWDGAQFHVIEAKGGGSQLGKRQQSSFHKDTDGGAIMAVARTLNLSGGAMGNLNLDLFEPDGTAKAFSEGDNIPPAVKAYLPTTLYQGTMAYLVDVAHAMSKSDAGDGRNLIGQAILDNQDTLHYVPVNAKVSGSGVDVNTMDLDS